MTSLSRFIARSGLAACVLLAGFGGTAWAQTASNTTINNNATLSYSVNGTAQTSICSSPGGNNNATCTNTSFQVDTKVNVNVQTTDTVAIATTPGSTGTMNFQVTNTGNAAQDISLAAVFSVANGQTVFSSPNTATDSFDPSACTVYDSAGTTVITKLSSVPASPAAGSTVTVKVTCTITALKGGTAAYASSAPLDYALVGLRATVTPLGSTTPMAEAARVGATPGVVLADGIGTDDLNSTTPNRDASFSARSALKAVPASLNIAKTVATLCDPFNGTTGPKNIPGAIVRYTITITNASGAPASAVLTQIADTLDTNLVGDVDFVAGATPAQCALVGAGGVATFANGSGVQVKWNGAARTSFGGTTGTKYQAAALTSTALNISAATWASLLPGTDGSYAAGELKAGDTVQVIFNAQIK